MQAFRRGGCAPLGQVHWPEGTHVASPGKPKAPAGVTSSSTGGNWLQGQRFGRVPDAVLADDRLSDEQRRVLIALICHADPGGRCFPLRNTIGALALIHPSNVSTACTALTDFGWVEIFHRSGRSSTFQLRIPVYALGQLPAKVEHQKNPKTGT